MDLGFITHQQNKSCIVIKVFFLSLFLSMSLPAYGISANSKHVIVISIDGGGSSFLKNSEMPNLARIISASANTFEARTVSPSVTLPSHVSMLTGVSPKVHGITWNNWLPSKGSVKVPTVFGRLKSIGLKTALFTAKDKFKHLNVKDSLDAFTLIEGVGAPVVKAAAEYIIKDKPNFIFIHIPDGDIAGHKYGWGSAEQIKVFSEVDSHIGAIQAAVEAAGLTQDTTLIVTADHGGEGVTHGAPKPINWTIPWIATGSRVLEGVVLNRDIQTYDTAATVLWLFGADTTSLEGQPITEAFN